MSPTGGRITVFQASLPNIGPGALKPREDPNQRAAKDVPNLNAATDFYKKFALDCSGQQVAVDLFLLGGQYMDIASLCKYYFVLQNQLLHFLICLVFHSLRVKVLWWMYVSFPELPLRSKLATG